MKLTRLIFLCSAFIFFSCSDDDDDDGVSLRDEAEVYQEDQAEILNYLQNHYYVVVPNAGNANYDRIEFRDITEDTPDDVVPIIDSEFLKSKTVTQNEINYTLYYLQVDEGAPTEYQPTFADEVVLTYRGELFDQTLFDQAINPIKFDFPSDGIIKGLVQSLMEFRGASSVTENNDGTLSYSEDYGLGAVFIPSGLAYFAEPPSLTQIAPYEPIIFSFQLYKGILADHDGDGIPSYYEDLNGDQVLTSEDNSNREDVLDFRDPDDDGDGTPTSEEIEVNDANGDGIITVDEITFLDYNNDGTPDYLDPEVN